MVFFEERLCDVGGAAVLGTRSEVTLVGVHFHYVNRGFAGRCDELLCEGTISPGRSDPVRYLFLYGPRFELVREWGERCFEDHGKSV